MDCRRQVWSDVARNGDVVRQRLVAASHQARGAMPPDSQKYAGKQGSGSILPSRTLSALNACRQSMLTPARRRLACSTATTDPENRSRHGDRTNHAVHVYRKEAHPQEL